MDRLSQFLDHLKERFSSPFFFSFIVSWIVCNWEIVVALLWYDPPKTSPGHLGLIRYINDQTNNVDSILLPIVFACLYTFLWPIINNWIAAFNAWNSKWGDKVNMKITQGGYVPIERYFAMREKYDTNLKALDEVITSESATRNSLQHIEATLSEERRIQNELRGELAETKAIVDNYGRVSIIGGKWSKISKGSFGTQTENIDIQNSNIYLYEDNSMNQKYSIHNFSYERSSGRLSFTLFHFESGDRPTYTFFSFNDLMYRHNELAGVEYRKNEPVTVRYVKSENP